MSPDEQGQGNLNEDDAMATDSTSSEAMKHNLAHAEVRNTGRDVNKTTSNFNDLLNRQVDDLERPVEDLKSQVLSKDTSIAWRKGTITHNERMIDVQRRENEQEKILLKAQREELDASRELIKRLRELSKVQDELIEANKVLTKIAKERLELRIEGLERRKVDRKKKSWFRRVK